jgi:Microtubule-binding protein MIP-T3 CH-like domain
LKETKFTQLCRCFHIKIVSTKMADLDALIESVKTQMGGLIQKPKMTEKLLQKPPFRFLHDTISAVTVTTGFGEGLYSGNELDSATITEKQTKIDYLEKIFRLVGICRVSIESFGTRMHKYILASSGRRCIRRGN